MGEGVFGHGGEMRKIEWQASFETGVPEIDDEHRAIVRAVNTLSEAIAGGRYGDCEALAAEFIGLARNHFINEEAILAKARFPGLAEHAARHQDLLHLAASVARRCAEVKDVAAARQCFEDMVDFLVKDVIAADLECKSHLEELGLVRPAH